MSNLQVTTKLDKVIFTDPKRQLHNFLSVSFHRTLRLPDDGKVYPLPPSLGQFPVRKVDDYLDTVPESWKQHGGVFIPMYQREAMWISFDLKHNVFPKAIKVAVGKVNVVTGEEWTEELQGKGQNKGQNYCVAPVQRWLDGINNGEGTIRQFVAMPLGQGYSVEAQVTGKEEFGGLQLKVFDSVEEKRIERFGTKLRPESNSYRGRGGRGGGRGGSHMDGRKRKRSSVVDASTEETEMGLSAGGKMKQKIIEDPYGLSFWDENTSARVFIHIVNSEMYKKITGSAAPPTPITAQSYTDHGYSWFDQYEEGTSSVSESAILSEVKSVKQMDQEKFTEEQQDDTSVQITKEQVISLPPPKGIPKNSVRDGEWN